MNKNTTDYRTVIKRIYFIIGVVMAVFTIILIVKEYHRNAISTKLAIIDLDFKVVEESTEAVLELIHSSHVKLLELKLNKSSSNLVTNEKYFEIIEHLKQLLESQKNKLLKIENNELQHYKNVLYINLINKISSTVTKLNAYQTSKLYEIDKFKFIVAPLNSSLHQYFQHHKNLELEYLAKIKTLKYNQLVLIFFLSLFIIFIAVYSVLKTLKLIKLLFEEKEQSEKELALSENNFREITENANEGILVSLDGKHVFANRAICELLGYDKNELLGTGVEDIVHSDDVERVKTNFKNRMNGKFSPREYEVKLVSKNGESICVELYPTITQWLDRKASQVFIHDIRERKKEQRKLKEQSLIIDQIHDSVVSTDLNGLIMSWSKGSEKLFGYCEDEIIGQNIAIIYPLDELDYLKELMNVLKISGEHETEIRCMCKDRSQFYGHLSLSLQYDKNGNAIGMIGYTIDITGRKQAEDELALYRLELEDLVEERTLELQYTIEKLQLENRERIKIESLLMSAKHEADFANLQKTNFLNRMSHELRTPMNAVLGFTQLIQMDAVDVEQNNYINEILVAGRHLQEMIDEVLDLSKIESGNIHLNINSVSIIEVVLESISLIQSDASDRGITIINNVDDENDLVSADYVRLKEIIVNLLTNAIKYNNNDGSITINKIRESGKICLTVIDTGIGIGNKNKNDIFEPFNRIGAEFSDIPGTGIGLSITKKLIELMDGSIGFDSEVGKGTTFWIKLNESKLKVQLQSQSMTTTISEVNNEINQSTIVYIEDNAANLRLVEQMLKRLKNMTLLSRNNAEDGIALIRNEKPDLVILDINLPGMNGFQALEIIQNDNELKKIPIFALSAAATAHDIERGLLAGFKRYLTKPIQVIDFISAIQAVIKTV